MILRKKIGIALLAGLIITGGISIYTKVSTMKDIIDTKNSYIEELMGNIQAVEQEIINKDHELDNLNNKTKKLQEDMEAIQQELDTKKGRLEEFEAILSSSVIPITLQELDLFFRLVEAEAGNEDMIGKIAVANVVINRVRDSRFPNTVTEVIYQPYQFQPVANGHINKIAPADSKEAVLRALKGEQVVSSDTIGFWATYVSRSHELWRLPITNQIGIHVFTNKF